MDAVITFLQRVSPADGDLIEAYTSAKERAHASQANYRAWLNNEREPYPVLPEGPEGTTIPGLELVLRICAARYADHPDYPKDQP
ncbi:hypothetical protein [Microbispora rosea]|uniref:hypothetical protein n=1 Tax=Microbispora rosea TaxID=58117 RepID=UPI0012DC13B9|nr:hypothetical protein [Microbispora rosea]